MSRKIFRTVENSKQIHGTNHNEETKTMQIKFVNGDIYEYNPINLSTYAEFLASEKESMGKYFAKNIKNNVMINFKKIN